MEFRIILTSEAIGDIVFGVASIYRQIIFKSRDDADTLWESLISSRIDIGDGNWQGPLGGPTSVNATKVKRIVLVDANGIVYNQKNVLKEGRYFVAY